ncbi:hypothetical protein TrVE_jg4580 [Triparma verrucosa]|uniref:Helicase C-terminal domain-containing protein n=1 Tax=Triparma verrucosa TaxID=1606542 RepID=A0A9W7CG12_9STRA|nr:hypothetical protein TrVE_jg4580 [Triparma verrucosa]
MPSMELDEDSVQYLLKEAYEISYDKYVQALGPEAVENVLEAKLEDAFDNDNPDKEFCFSIFEDMIKENEKKNSEKNSKKNNENVDTVNRRVTMTPTGSPSKKKKAKAAPTPVVEESGHDTDASDDEYWAKKQKQSKPKPSTQTFVTGTAVTKNKKSGSIRDYDKDSKLYTVLFESGERKTFKENQIRKMLTSKGEKVSEEDLADMEVEESDKAESDEEFGEADLKKAEAKEVYSSSEDEFEFDDKNDDDEEEQELQDSESDFSEEEELVKKSTKKARTAKSSFVVTKTSSVDDSDDDAFETSAKKTLPSKKLKGTSKVMVDEEDEDMTDLLAPDKIASKKEATKAPKAPAGKPANAFAMMMGAKSPTAPTKKRAAPKTTKATTKRLTPGGSKNRNAQLKTAYTDGAGLPVLSHPQDMFDDLMTKAPEFEDVVKLLSRPLRIATMCSGTESPVLALDMMSRAAEEQYGVKLEIEHLFSCEIEPFKQAYIERNFQPPILFRDIRELGRKKAVTAFGSLVDVPGGADMLIAGTSCVDYSNLNNEKKTITGSGESGQTFRGMLDWIKKNEPPIVILENVSGAPWETKVKIFEQELGYHATFARVDTKKYYIPQTRSRGYLFAVKKDRGVSSSAPAKWKGMVESFRRDASASLDSFMFPSDDPRVLKGRERLSAGRGDAGERTGRVDWARCEARHLFARSDEELGDKRPLTGWSDSGNTALPSYGWNDWANAQVHRIHDLMDINTLRLAKEGVDGTYKTMVWNLSQNVDRDTMGKLGLCQCLTPTGVPYVSNRGGPLVGEELLLLQGIPADDLTLTRETEENLKDLAGNAMSTTVVGSCMLAALIVSKRALKPEGEPTYTGDVKGGHIGSLVPRALDVETGDVKITDKLGKYENTRLKLAPVKKMKVSDVMKRAAMSCRRCNSEGRDLVSSNILICKDCGNTASVECALPPRKFEEHNYEKFEGERLNPAVFHKEFLNALPMRVKVGNLVVTDEMKPENVDGDFWNEWKAKFTSRTTEAEGGKPVEFNFKKLVRGEVWVASYHAPGAQLELSLNEKAPIWLLKIDPPSAVGKLRDTLERPVARMMLKDDAKDVLDGVWEVCLPVDETFQISITGQGNKVQSWEARIGLKGRFGEGKRFSTLDIKVAGEDEAKLSQDISGTYDLLEQCGTARGSLHKKRQANADAPPLYFFLESGRCTTPEQDSFIFSKNRRRLIFGEERGVIASLSPKWQPKDVDGEQKIRATVPGLWTETEAAFVVIDDAKATTFQVPKAELKIALKKDTWKQAVEVVSAKVPLARDGRLWKMCKAEKTGDKWTEVNLKKSKKVFDELAWVTSRLSVPENVKAWNSLETEGDLPYGFDCFKCAPTVPGVAWKVVSKGGKQSYQPQEDVQEAGAYENALKARPQPFKLQLRKEGEIGRLQIGMNGMSLVQRARALLPKDSAAVVAMDAADAEAEVDKRWKFQWRIVEHEEFSKVPEFTNLKLTSNKKDEGAEQPPNFKKYPLRPEQLRSLSWMLAQEATTVPFEEEEVAEAILGPMGWRAEGRVKRPVLVRGGIVADQVGYGKTAITLGLIDAAEEVNGPAPKFPTAVQKASVFTKATLVVVPSHLMGQWPKEVAKFTGKSKVVIVIKDMSSFNNLTVKEVQDADIVVVNFTVLAGDKYHERLARLSGANAGSLPGSKRGGRHFDSVYGASVNGLEERCTLLREDRASAYEAVEKDAYKHWREEKDAQETGLGMRLDGKKSVYKKVSESKTKLEVEKEDVEMSDVKEAAKEEDVTMVDVADDSETDNSDDEENEAGMKGEKKLIRRVKMGNDEYHKKMAAKDKDPWGLCEKPVQKDLGKMKCPPLELFCWNRVVIDEFHYLAQKQDRARVLTLVLGLKSNFRWCLSGTPPHENFDDVESLAKLLGIHLGIPDVLPAANGARAGRGKKASEKDKTSMEKFSDMMDLKSVQWHERRHELSQSFLDRFVRQNIAEIDEIPQEEHLELVTMPPAERAVYLELETHLKSLEMNSQKAKKSKKSSKGDREKRMNEILEDSKSAEEALLKRCAHFDLAGNSTSALETCENIIKMRTTQMDDCVKDLTKQLAAAIRQRREICKIQKNWEGMVNESGGEVNDRLRIYENDVENMNSVSGGADNEVHELIKTILTDAEAEAEEFPDRKSSRYSLANVNLAIDYESEDETEEAEAKRAKKKIPKDGRTRDEKLYAMKYALREHVHALRTLNKELAGRMRSLRYFRCVLEFNQKDVCVPCNGAAEGRSCCAGKTIKAADAGVLSSCGHTGCLKCLEFCTAREECIDPSCKAPCKSSSIVTGKELGCDEQHKAGGKWGAKLTEIVKSVKKLIDAGDRVLVFVQFKDLKQKVAEALEAKGVKTLQVKGTVQTQIKSLDVMQKEVPAANDPRCLLLTMDDESSSGVNLTHANHAVFVHPLLASTQALYTAYETQAIGRVRRYGQKKTVHLHRFVCVDTIDSEIFEEKGRAGLEERKREKDQATAEK